MPTARQVTWAKFRVTMAVIAALAIFSVLGYLLTGGTLFTAKATVFTYIPDATALSKDSPVRVNGVDVGHVNSVALSGSNEPNRIVRVTMEVEQDYLSKIPTDSYVEVSTDNVVGDKFVDITRGKSTQTIRANSEIPFKPQQGLLKTLDLREFEQQIRTVEATLDDIEQGRSELGEFVMRDDVYNALLRYINGLQKSLQGTVAPGTALGSLVYSDQLYQQIRQPVVQLDATLARLQSGQSELGRLLRDDARYEQLRSGIADMRKTIASVQSSQLLQSDQQYADWNRLLATYIRNINDIAASPLLSSSAEYDNLAGMGKQLHDSLAEFRKDPQKFLRLKLF